MKTRVTLLIVVISSAAGCGRKSPDPVPAPVPGDAASAVALLKARGVVTASAERGPGEYALEGPGKDQVCLLVEFKDVNDLPKHFGLPGTGAALRELRDAQSPGGSYYIRGPLLFTTTPSGHGRDLVGRIRTALE